MKGIRKVEINGEEIAFRFTLGVAEDLQEYAKRFDVSEEEMESGMKHVRFMISLMELYSTDAWKEPDIIDRALENSVKYKGLDISKMQEITDMIQEAKEGVVKNPKAGKKK